MTPAARVATAIAVLDAIAAAARDDGPPADAVLADAMKARRYAGSKDRRAIRDLVYDAMRAVRSLPPSGRAAMLTLAQSQPDLAALFDGSGYGPAAIDPAEPRAVAGLCAPALLDHFDPLVGPDERAALLDRAPLDIRVNPLRGDRAAVLAAFPDARSIAGLPHGLRLPAGTAVATHPLYDAGVIEVQDAASQYAAMALDARGGMLVVDLCAGAGGKTLALASAMGGAGRLVACDINRRRLQRLEPRTVRAGAQNIETRLLNPGQESAMLADLAGKADRVIVDAPCSGSGTWRRSPELRWRLTPARLAAAAAAQAQLLALGAMLLAPGGRLVYAVCSILTDEGRSQMAAFADSHTDYQPVATPLPAGIGRAAGAHGWLLTPGHDDTDGFFVATVQRA